MEDDFIQEYGNSSFIKSLGLLEDYEKVPRKPMPLDSKLPIKVNGKVVKVNQPKVVDSSSEEEQQEEFSDEETSIAQVPKKKSEQKPKEKTLSVNQVKEELARMASLIIENPEKHVSLIDYRSIY